MKDPLDHLDDEIRDFIERETRDNLGRGMSPEDARAAAKRKFGNATQVQEDARSVWRIRWLEDLWQDVRYGARGLRLNPGHAAAVVLTLALGIGATTAIFSVVRAVLFPKLAYPGADRLVRIVENTPASESFTGRPTRGSAMSASEIAWWRTRTTTLSDFSVSSGEQRMLASADGPVRVRGARVSPSWFSMRGVQPVLGRWLTEQDAQANVAVISAATWQRFFGSDRAVLGRTLALDGASYAIAGVMPPEVGDTAFWRPFALETPRPGVNEFIAVAARLKDGVALDTATAEADRLGHQLRGTTAEPGAPPRFEVERVIDQEVTAFKPAMRVLAVCVAVLLLIVCTNVANLVLARGVRRTREIGLRRALGAARGRVLRQMLTENLVLALAGGAAGTALAYGGVRLLRVLATNDLPRSFRGGALLGFDPILPRVNEIGLDFTMLTIALLVSVLASVLFGVVPAIQTSRTDHNVIRNASARGSAGSRSRTGDLLAVAQLALATVLLICAGLLSHSFLKLSNVHVGFDAEHQLSFSLNLPANGSLARNLASAHNFAARLESLPEIEAAGFSGSTPLSGSGWTGGSAVPAGLTPQELRGVDVQNWMVSPDYLRALGVRLLDGRWITEDDASRGPEAVLVNRAFARRFFGDRSPVGASVRVSGELATVAGVIDDIHSFSLYSDPGPMSFRDPRHDLARLDTLRDDRRAETIQHESFAMMRGASLSFAVRTKGDPLAIVPTVRAVLRSAEPDATMEGIADMEDVLSGVTARERFYAAFAGVFAALAGVLAAIGVYGVLSYAVTQRTAEIGIRIALGAQRQRVLAMVLGRGLTLVGIGIGAGLAAGVAASRSLAGMLFGLEPFDPFTYAAVAVLFAAIALVASGVPALRAARVDPSVALRHD